jgi:hypothetical protein
MKSNTLLAITMLIVGLSIHTDENNPSLYKYNGHLAALSFEKSGTTKNIKIISDQFTYDAPGTSSLVNVEIEPIDSSIDMYAHDSDAGNYYKINNSNSGTLAGYVQAAKGSTSSGINAEKIANVITGTDSGPFITAYSFATKSEKLSGCYQNYDGRTWIYDIIKDKNSGWLCTIQQGSASFNLLKPIYGTIISDEEYKNGPTMTLINPSGDGYSLIKSNSVIQYLPYKGKAQDTANGVYYTGVGNSTYQPPNAVCLGSYKDGNGTTQYVAGSIATKDEYNAI